MQLYADPAPDSDGIMLLWQDEKELYADFWDGATMQWLQLSMDKLETINIVTDQPFTFTWTRGRELCHHSCTELLQRRLQVQVHQRVHNQVSLYRMVPPFGL